MESCALRWPRPIQLSGLRAGGYAPNLTQNTTQFQQTESIMAGEQLAYPPLHSEFQTTLEMCQEGKGSGEGKGKKKGTTQFLFLMDTEHASISPYLSREGAEAEPPVPH